MQCGIACLQMVCKYFGRDYSLESLSKHFTMQTTPQNEVLIVPYDAKNIYMVQYHNDGHKWSPEREPVISLFNEYYGGGMNSVVFQELRESRGLAYSA